MATYAIGDIQGCYFSLQKLLAEIRFNPAFDQLWLVGDIINRGAGSLEVLRWVYEHQCSIVTVLGNHDLHALVVAHGYVRAHKGDTLQALLDAPDADKLLAWLRHQPLIHRRDDYIMVHAGLLPQWSGEQALVLGAEVELALQSHDYKIFLAHMYGNEPCAWDEGLKGWDRLRLITNAMTRLRVCNGLGQMDFKFKGELDNIPSEGMPWFDVPLRKSQDSKLIFGHWSALGLILRDNLYALDTGCLWGGKLTALRLEDKSMFQVSCQAEDAPLKVNFSD